MKKLICKFCKKPIKHKGYFIYFICMCDEDTRIIHIKDINDHPNVISET